MNSRADEVGEVAWSLRCPPRGRNSRLEAALRPLTDPPALAASSLRCPPRGRNSRLEAALRRLNDPPTLAASPLRCPPRGRNSRLEAALRRSSGPSGVAAIVGVERGDDFVRFLVDERERHFLYVC